MLLAIAPMQAAVVALDYRLRDPDSLLYADLADQLAGLWLALFAARLAVDRWAFHFLNPLGSTPAS